MKNFIITILVVLVAVFGYLAFKDKFKTLGKVKEPETKEETPTPAENTYKNYKYNFSFKYSSENTVKEESKEKILILNSKGIAQTEINVITGDLNEDPYEQFVLDESRLWCGTLTPSINCTEISKLTSYKSKSGENGESFYLKSEKGENIGPFYAFNISEHLNVKAGFLLIHAPVGFQGASSDLTKVLNTLSI